MKKILFVHQELVIGGAESALFDLIRSLDKTKYDVAVLTVTNNGDWDNKFKNEGIRIIPSYEMNDKYTGFQKYLYHKKVEYSKKHGQVNLIELSTNEKFDLIVIYHIYKSSCNVAKKLDCKKIRYIHGDVDSPWLHKILDLEKHHLSDYDKFICVSKLARDTFVKHFGLEEKTIVINNPLYNLELKEKANEPIEEQLPNKYICAVGRLSPEKGYKRLIVIHSELIKEGILHNLVIVGDGKERPILENTISELKVNETVKMVGFKENPYPYIKNSIFTVISSFSEGLPVVSFESLSLSKPIVSSFPTVEEAFGNKCCGIITDMDDDSLKAGIKKMLTDESFYKKTCECAEKRSEELTPENMVSIVENIYDFLMEEI